MVFAKYTLIYVLSPMVIDQYTSYNLFTSKKTSPTSAGQLRQDAGAGTASEIKCSGTSTHNNSLSSSRRNTPLQFFLSFVCTILMCDLPYCTPHRCVTSNTTQIQTGVEIGGIFFFLHVLNTIIFVTLKSMSVHTPKMLTHHTTNTFSFYLCLIGRAHV